MLKRQIQRARYSSADLKQPKLIIETIERKWVTNYLVFILWKEASLSLFATVFDMIRVCMMKLNTTINKDIWQCSWNQNSAAAEGHAGQRSGICCAEKPLSNLYVHTLPTGQSVNVIAPSCDDMRSVQFKGLFFLAVCRITVKHPQIFTVSPFYQGFMMVSGAVLHLAE